MKFPGVSPIQWNWSTWVDLKGEKQPSYQVESNSVLHWRVLLHRVHAC